jgi:phosphoglycerol transferase
MSQISAPAEPARGFYARHRQTLESVAIPVGQAVFIAACLYLYLRGWTRDFSIPLGFSNDSLVAILQSKSTVENGWWWFNPMVGAPAGYDQLAFPANSNVDQSIVWAVSRFVPHAVTALNLAWMLIVVLGGVSATWCLRKLDVSTSSALVAGTLFGLSPYALYRNIVHIWMVIYLVPFACAAALLLASGRLEKWRESRSSLLLFGGCALLGFNYVYYAFFACFFLLVGSLVGFAETRRKRVLVAGAVGIAVITGCTFVNLAPSLQSWSRHGRPVILHDKLPMESELYALKIRQLVSPAIGHALPAFHRWTDKEVAATFQLEGENTFSRLGFIGTVGFVGLLGLLFWPAAATRFRGGAALSGASRLTLAALLLATIGGFGSLVALLVTPEIRAYNRITPFILFFSLTAVALAIDSLRSRRWRIAATAAVLAVGLVDHKMATIRLNADHGYIARQVRAVRAFVEPLERGLPAGAMVLQLPFRTFLSDPGVARMEPYDHLRLYVVSKSIRWSYPALSNEQVLWQYAAARLSPRELPSQLAAEGFSAIVVDRNGYDDNGTATIAAVREGLGGGTVIAETERYIALDLRSLAGSAAGSRPRLQTQLVVASASIGECGGRPVATIDQIGAARAPFMTAPSVRGSSGFKVIGWAVDHANNSTAAAVDLVIDQIAFPTFYGADRPNVVDYLKRPAYFASGFLAYVPPHAVAAGSHTISLRVVSSNRSCYHQSAGISVVVR